MERSEKSIIPKTGEQKEKGTQFSSIVALPYTSRINEQGNIRISSHTALLLDAVFALYQKSAAPSIFIPGENTFGKEYISTASLMKEWLVKRGVPEEKIIAADNLNNTEEQLNEVKRRGLENPLIVCLGFHKDRVRSLAKRIRIKGEVQEAEPIIIDEHGIKNPEKLNEFIGSKDRYPFNISKVDLAEFIGKNGEKFGRPGRIAVKLFRKVMRAEGATVTDFHHVEPAKQHLERAIGEGKSPDKAT